MEAPPTLQAPAPAVSPPTPPSRSVAPPSPSPPIASSAPLSSHDSNGACYSSRTQDDAKPGQRPSRLELSVTRAQHEDAERHTEQRYSSSMADRATSEEAAEAKAQELQKSSPLGRTDVVLLILMVGLVLTSVVVPFLAWEEEVDQQRRELDAQFKTVRAEYAAALEARFMGTVKRMDQYVALLEHHRSIESFTTYASSDPGFATIVAYLPRVEHSERATFERETYAELSAFLNGTAGASNISPNITSFVLSGSNIVGVEVSPVKPVYFPISLVYPAAVSLMLRDLNSEPLRHALINDTYTTGNTIVSSRLLTLDPDGNIQTSTFVVRNVPDIAAPNDPSHSIGVFGVSFRWSALIATATEFLSSASVRLQLFDISGFGPDQTGCEFPALFDGTLEPEASLWEAADVGSVCFDTLSDVYDQVSTGAEERHSIKFGDRTLLAVFSRGPSFDEAGPARSHDMFTLLMVLVSFALAQIVVVLVRGYHLLNMVLDSHRTVYAMHKSTKEFFSFITHELRNPLFAVLGTAGALRDSIEGRKHSDDEVEMVASIETASDRMSSIINDVLSMRKLEEGRVQLESEAFKLGHVAHELITTFGVRALREGLVLEVVVGEGLPAVLVGDDGRLVQVLSNLISNALKFTSDGGTISVTVQPVTGRSVEELEAACGTISTSTELRTGPAPASAQAPAHHAVHLAGVVRADIAWVEFRVRDSGAGIPPEAIPHLFTPYTQANASISRTHGGTGLGLSIVRMLVQCMGGHVQVASEYGRGTEFGIVLPFEVGSLPEAASATELLDPRLSDPPTDAPALVVSSKSLEDISGAGSSQPGSTPEQRRSSMMSGISIPENAVLDPLVLYPTTRRAFHADRLSGAILVVDDQRMNVRVLKRMLNKTMPEVQVDSASNGREAVDAVFARERSGDPYFLVFMDIIMPVMDGRQAVAELRARGFDGPVLAVTGGGEQEDLEANVEAGFTDSVLKPLKHTSLLGLLQRYVRKPGSTHGAVSAGSRDG